MSASVAPFTCRKTTSDSLSCHAFIDSTPNLEGPTKAIGPCCAMAVAHKTAPAKRDRIRFIDLLLYGIKK
jgi:hypothetical protein